MLKDLYSIAKPRLILLNLFTFTGGFALAVRGTFPAGLFAASLAGAALGMASGSTLNNIIDRDIDRLMARTRLRPLAAGSISPRAALAWAGFLGAAGLLVLSLSAPPAAVAAGIVGYLFYVVVYSLWLKRRTPLAVLAGSVAGAAPPVVGYAAAAGRIDLGAALLFFILVLWQLPHFFAIALRRLEDYRAARLPAFAVVHGRRASKIAAAVSVAAFALTSPLPYAFGYAGRTYLAVSALSGAVWLVVALLGFPTRDDARWGRRMLIASVLVLAADFTALAATAVRP